MVQLVEVAQEFPVVLYDGERQINVGNIEIHRTIDFQKFRTILKQMIGISYNNLTTYLVERSRKILITSKVDIFMLVREKNAYFLVVMKRSRRERRRKNYNRSSVKFSPAELFDYHLMIHNLNCEFYSHTNANFLRTTEAYPAVETYTTRPLCEECTEADRTGLKPEFHLCVYDDVVEGFFRSPAGPISGPKSTLIDVSG